MQHPLQTNTTIQEKIGGNDFLRLNKMYLNVVQVCQCQKELKNKVTLMGSLNSHFNLLLIYYSPKVDKPGPAYFNDLHQTR